MITVTFTGKFTKTKEVWFSDTYHIPKRCDYASLRALPEVGDGIIGQVTQQHSLLTDLTLDEEQLFALCTKGARNGIRRGEKEGVTLTMFNNEALRSNPEILHDLLTMYERLYESKGQVSLLNMTTLKGYLDSGSLVITQAVYDGEPLVYHAYVCDTQDKKAIRLLYSCSNYRSEESTQFRNLIGFANRFLTWGDILYFKGLNYEKLDWGGVFSFEEPNGIDKFKMEFGGTPITYYNVLTPASLIAKMKWKLMRKK